MDPVVTYYDLESDDFSSENWRNKAEDFRFNHGSCYNDPEQFRSTSNFFKNYPEVRHINEKLTHLQNNKKANSKKVRDS